MTARALNSEPTRFTGRTVLAWTIGFFAVICAVNALLTYFALTTFNGEVGRQPYRDGLEFNRALAEIAAQKALGWTVETTFRPGAPGTVQVEAHYRDAEKNAISDLAVTAHFMRPTSEGFDFEVPLVSQGEGAYTVSVTVPLRGHWQVRLTAAGHSTKPYVLDYPAFVP